MEPGKKLLAEFIACKNLSADWWRFSVVDLVAQKKPTYLSEITRHFTMLSAALDVISLLISAGLTGQEIIDTFWIAAQNAALELKKESEVEA